MFEVQSLPQVALVCHHFCPQFVLGKLARDISTSHVRVLFDPGFDTAAHNFCTQTEEVNFPDS